MSKIFRISMKYDIELKIKQYGKLDKKYGIRIDEKQLTTNDPNTNKLVVDEAVLCLKEWLLFELLSKTKQEIAKEAFDKLVNT